MTRFQARRRQCTTCQPVPVQENKVELSPRYRPEPSCGKLVAAMTSRVTFALLAVLNMPAAGPAPAAAAALCDSTTKRLIPLTELAPATYLGEPGGLYPGAVNTMPAAHLADGLDRAGTITALDTLGLPSASGLIVVLSVGMSNTTQEFSTFVPLANGSGLMNPRVLLVDGAQGGQTAAVFADPNANAWTVIDNRLRSSGVRAAQVQAVWLKEANARPTQGFPLHAQILRDDLRAVVQNLHAKFPNLKLCYLSSRIYAGYASTALNPEPYAYESAFAVRWLIEEQLDGNAALNPDANAGPVVAPWLAWGPYLWADGLVPRADGLTWACADFSTSDGTHPATSGRTKVALLLLAFFTSDATAAPWFTMQNVAVAPASPPGTALRIASVWPNPARGVLFAEVNAPRAMNARFDLITVDGRVARRFPEVRHQPPPNTPRWAELSTAGGLASGIYFLRARADEQALSSTRGVVIVR